MVEKQEISSHLTYFITGTNRGIGFELVKQLLSKGERVIATVRRTEDITTELSITKDPNLTVLNLDFNDSDSFIKLSTELRRLNVGIDVFISNAALNTAKTSVLDSSPEEYFKFLKVNTIGPIELIKILKPYLLKKPTRKIVLTSSILGSIAAFPDFISKTTPCAPYNVSKAASNLLGRQLSYELADEKFIVINYHPGLINTRVVHPPKIISKVDVDYSTNDDTSGVNKQTSDEKLLEYFAKHRLTVEDGVSKELKIIANLSLKDSGKFLTYDGSEIEY
ncbi:hypothetical protein WICMUC_002182 [Wickerhamomyces mucosus]|uniref:NAD(P)-binding protein n=1 Tax=Wickerhamomyces mucosus TaxID=1378264 RepID=A0A9P8TF03_9ASCO|nr:hypothetical protein WICMUC_002182 [Wickerhamomyces mucosus]